MITIFNRRELMNTYDMGKQAAVRGILADNHIDYHIKTVNRNSPSPLSAGTRASFGTLGQNPNIQNEYIIYVKKSDYEKARSLVFGR